MSYARESAGKVGSGDQEESGEGERRDKLNYIYIEG
jgi:hypothetical protein